MDMGKYFEEQHRRLRKMFFGICNKHENMIVKWDRSAEGDECPVCKLLFENIELNKKIKSLEDIC